MEVEGVEEERKEEKREEERKKQECPKLGGNGAGEDPPRTGAATSPRVRLTTVGCN